MRSGGVHDETDCACTGVGRLVSCCRGSCDLFHSRPGWAAALRALGAIRPQASFPFHPDPRQFRLAPAQIGERVAMMDAIHRILSGQPLTPRELRWAGAVVAIWFLMDLVEWLDWLIGKFQ